MRTYAGFFLPKEKAHRSGPYSYHHFLLGVVPGASGKSPPVPQTIFAMRKKHIRPAMPSA
jgi:hypothetical protein